MSFISRRLAKRLGFAVASTLLFLVILDTGIGFVMRRTPPYSLTKLDTTLFFRLNPGREDRLTIGFNSAADWNSDAPRYHISINRDGYRGPLVDKAKLPGEFRVLCMGDSITMGGDVDDDQTFSAQTERLLQERFPQTKVTVINGGVLGYSSRQGLYLFQDKFVDYRPDVVVWGFGFNDQSPMQFLDVADVTMIPTAPGLAASGITWSKRVLFWLIRRPTVQAVRVLILPTIWRAYYARFLSQISEHPEFAAQVQLKEDRYNKSRVPPRDSVIHLLEMQRLAQKYNFTLLVAEFWGTPAVYRDAAKNFCETNNLPFVDFTGSFGRIFQTHSLADQPELEQIFREVYAPYLKPDVLEKQPMFYYTTDNLHPNQCGHRLIAHDLDIVIAMIARNRKP